MHYFTYRTVVGGYTGFSVSICRPCSVFRTYFGLIFQMLKWNLVWLFTMMSYRSSLSFVVIDQYLTELWALGLRIFMKFSVFRTFFGLIFQILKWNWVWLLTMMSYRSSLSLVVIDEYLTELWTLGHKIFMKISVYGTLYNTITLQKNLSDLSISWVFHVLLYCRIYASAFSLIALKIKLKFSMGLH